MFERGRSEGPRLFGLYPNGLFTFGLFPFGLFWTTGTCGLSLLDDYEVWTIAIRTILVYKGIWTIAVWSTMTKGLTIFRLLINLFLGVIEPFCAYLFIYLELPRSF